MRVVAVMSLLKNLTNGHREGVVTVSVRDLTEWMADLTEAIKLLQESNHQGCDWQRRRHALLSHFEEHTVH